MRSSELQNHVLCISSHCCSNQNQRDSLAFAFHVTQADRQTLLSACIAGTRERPIAPLGVLRIQRLQLSVDAIAPFSVTLKHLILPELTGRAILKLPGVVRALTGLQARAACPVHAQYMRPQHY